MNGVGTDGAEAKAATRPEIDGLVSQLAAQGERYSGLATEIGAVVTRLRNTAGVPVSAQGVAKAGVAEIKDQRALNGLHGLVVGYTDTNDRLGALLAALNNLV